MALFGDQHPKLNITAFGLAGAIVCALIMVVYSVLASTTGFGIEMETVFESIEPGYTLTLPGVIVGTIWAFVYGYLIAALFSWIYNKLAVAKK
jgi:hypothetical protein